MISTGWSWTNLTKCDPRTTAPAWSIRTTLTWRTPRARNKRWMTASVESKPVCWRTKPTSACCRNNRGRHWRNPTPRWPAGQVRVKRSSRSWKPPKLRFPGRRSSPGRQLNRPDRRPPPPAPPRVPCLCEVTFNRCFALMSFVSKEDYQTKWSDGSISQVVFVLTFWFTCMSVPWHKWYSRDDVWIFLYRLLETESDPSSNLSSC